MWYHQLVLDGPLGLTHAEGGDSMDWTLCIKFREGEWAKEKREVTDHDSEAEARAAWDEFQPPPGHTITLAVILPPGVRLGNRRQIDLLEEASK